MELKECVLTRRSVRKFLDKPVDHATLEQVIATAAYAPSWKNTQISRYIYCGCSFSHSAFLISKSNNIHLQVLYILMYILLYQVFLSLSMEKRELAW